MLTPVRYQKQQTSPLAPLRYGQQPMNPLSVTRYATTTFTLTSTPSVTGALQEGLSNAGTTLTSTAGTYSITPDSVAYQWQRSAYEADAWNDISGATSSTYTPVAGDRGYDVRCVITATKDSTTITTPTSLTTITQNYLPNSEDATETNWSVQSGYSVEEVLSETTREYRVWDVEGANASTEVVNISTLNTGAGNWTGAHSGSMWVKGEGSNIGKTGRLVIKRVGGTYAEKYTDFTLTSDWQLVTVENYTGQANNTGAMLIIRFVSGGADEIIFSEPQLNKGATALPYIPTGATPII